MTTTTTTTHADDANTGASTDDSAFMVQVTETLPSLEECYNFVVTDAGESCGAVSTFVGITRDNFQNKKVLKLSYEGYIPMAVKELTKLCHDACLKFGSVQKIVAVHIVGDCPVGQPSVILATSSPHRRDAMHCTEYLIDELKRRIPIWKREVYDGDDLEAVWKENVETREMERCG
jgi:molybdopterin synthase catalytic subunit